LQDDGVCALWVEFNTQRCPQCVHIDGQRIVSGSEDNTVRVWDAPERLLVRAISRISRPAPILTSAERQQLSIPDDVELSGYTELLIDPYLLLYYSRIMEPLAVPAWQKCEEWPR